MFQPVTSKLLQFLTDILVKTLLKQCCYKISQHHESAQALMSLGFNRMTWFYHLC